LLLNIGRMPLLVDEPIRALVALEMHYSGHFFQPTLQGLPYYNKPPLFNWLLIALFRLTGRQDEFILRLPTVAALLLYSGAIWRVLRPQLGSKTAFTVALAFATTGRPPQLARRGAENSVVAVEPAHGGSPATGRVGALRAAVPAWPVRLLDGLLLGTLLLSSVLVLGAPLARITPALTGAPQVQLANLVPGAWAWSLGIGVVLLGLAYLFWKLLDYRLLLLGYFLLVLRLAFDVFVFPARLQTSAEVAYRTAAIRVGRETRGRPLILLPNSRLDDVEAFYITRERGETLLTDSLPARPGYLYLGR
nr:hypothetical protein [Tanacetum cinerariifolium]